MRKAIVNVNRRPAGLLQEMADGKFRFDYQPDYLADDEAMSVSLTLPKRKDPYYNDYLFPCFFNLLSEGANKSMQCKVLRIEPDDYFGLLLATAQTDTAGFLTFTPVEDEKE